MNETTDIPVVEDIETSELHFDPQNPRFYRLNNHTSEESVIQDMLDEEGVSDLMMSIGQKGYFAGEPILVTKENGRVVVVEGNRRLAAVKLLNKEISPPPRRIASITQIIDEATEEAPTKLPCIMYPTRREVLRYLGYRHITGIREWDSLSKAKYLANIRDEFYKKLPLVEQMRALAKDIGSRKDYVAQLLTALNLYSNAEANDFFQLPIAAKDVIFSYITTAINYKNITDWLGLANREDTESPNLVEENLKDLFAWMFIKNQQGRTIIGESRNLDMMAAIVANDDAVKILKDTSNLDEAFLYSDGPQEALNNALESALGKSQMAWNLLVKIEEHTDTHLSLAEKLANSTRDIRNHLRSKLEN